MRGLILVTPPAGEPVSLTEAKAHLRIDSADDDSLIGALITAARQAAEAHMRRALITQTWRLTLDRFPAAPQAWWDGVRQAADMPGDGSVIELPRPPLVSVTSVTAYDDADNATVAGASSYFVDSDGEPGRIVLRSGQTWPAAVRVANGVEVVFVAGYGAASAVPQAIRQGMLMLIGQLFENREAMDGGAATAAFVAGYVIAWTAFSAGATAFQWGLERLALLSPMMVSSSPMLGGVLLIAAGVYQWSPMK